MASTVIGVPGLPAGMAIGVTARRVGDNPALANDHPEPTCDSIV
jgi:hypothetical protein